MEVSVPASVARSLEPPFSDHRAAYRCSRVETWRWLQQSSRSRVLLGSDAYNGVEKNDLARLEEARSWKELSLSTDMPSTRQECAHEQDAEVRRDIRHARGTITS